MDKKLNKELHIKLATLRAEFQIAHNRGVLSGQLSAFRDMIKTSLLLYKDFALVKGYYYWEAFIELKETAKQSPEEFETWYHTCEKAIAKVDAMVVNKLCPAQQKHIWATFQLFMENSCLRSLLL